MQKLYNIVKIMLTFALFFTQINLQAQKCCVECQADVKVVSDKQVLLEKIDLKAGTLTTNINTNVYVSYRSGNSRKFWTNLVIATAGVAVSTQLNKATLAEGRNANAISPLLPLGVSVATLPSIWKNRPRNVPQAGLWIQHRDTRGKLLETWEQPISSEAKNDAELLTVSIDKPLSEGTLEVYLQNGSKNGVYYWGYETTSKSKKSDNTILQNLPVALSIAGCPDGYLPNGQGMCCNFFNGECVSEGGGSPPPITPTPTPPPTPTGGGCPAGYLPNGQGMCCDFFTGNCISGGSSGGRNPTAPRTLTVTFLGCPTGMLSNGQGLCCNPSTNQCVLEATIANGVTGKKVITKTYLGPAPTNQSTNQTNETCSVVQTCIDWSWDVCTRDGGYRWNCSSYLGTSICWNELECDAQPTPIQDFPVYYPPTGGGGAGNGGNNEALEIRKRECLVASIKFRNDVSWAQFIREESKISCINALGMNKADALGLIITLAEAGASAYGLFVEVANLFGQLDDMWSCMTDADQQYNWDIEGAYLNQQSANIRLDCAHLY